MKRLPEQRKIVVETLPHSQTVIHVNGTITAGRFYDGSYTGINTVPESETRQLIDNLLSLEGINSIDLSAHRIIIVHYRAYDVERTVNAAITMVMHHLGWNRTPHAFFRRLAQNIRDIRSDAHTLYRTILLEPVKIINDTDHDTVVGIRRVS